MTSSPTPARDAVEEARGYARFLRNEVRVVHASPDHAVLILDAEIDRLRAEVERQKAIVGAVRADLTAANARIGEMEGERDGLNIKLHKMAKKNPLCGPWMKDGRELRAWQKGYTSGVAHARDVACGLRDAQGQPLSAPPSEAKDDGRGE